MSNQTNANTAMFWLRQLIYQSRSSSLFYALILIGLCCNICIVHQVSASETETLIKENEEVKSIPANHRSDSDEDLTKTNVSGSRQSRQFDGSLSGASSGSYAAISGDGAAYVAQGGSNYGSPLANAASQYANELASSYHPAGPYHDPMSMARGYSAPSMGPMHHNSGSSGYPGMTGISSIFPSTLGSGGLLSSSMFPLMSKGFDLSEIVCTAIAVAIGAVIIGAPFILIYLFVMNQMNGNGPGGMGPSGGAISLTGPTSSTTVNGRKKRHTSFSEALFKQLSPLVNSEQVASTFKALMSSMAKYQV